MLKNLTPKTRALIDKIIRIDHAGEYGANRIYEGQLAVLGKTKVGPTLQHMLEQEQHHLTTFEALIPKYRVRPTVFLPFWHVAGYALGAGTALVSKEAAMACTVAVESVIGEHYNDQIRELMEDDPEGHAELMEIIKQFRDEEMEHHDTGLDEGAELAPAYKFLSQVIKTGCHLSIKICEKL